MFESYIRNARSRAHSELLASVKLPTKLAVPSRHKLQIGHLAAPRMLVFLRNKKLLGALGAPGIATRSKDATRGSWPCY